MVPRSRSGLAPALSTLALCVYPLVVPVMLARTATPSALAINAVWLAVFMAVGTALHEMGHALAARAVGLWAYEAYVGRGPAVYTRRWGDTQVVIQAVPFTGSVFVTGAARHRLRRRLGAVYAAGPAVNVVLMALGIAWLVNHGGLRIHEFSAVPSAVMAWTWAHGLLAFVSLIPQPAKATAPDQSTRPGSDGWNLLTMPFRTEDALTPVVRAYAPLRATRLLEAGRPQEALDILQAAQQAGDDSVPVRVAITDALVTMGRWTQARPLLEALLANAKLPAAATPLLANNLAWTYLMLGDGALLPEADRLSNVALAGRPDLAFVHGTRGTVLLALGDLDAAEPRLMAAFQRNRRPNQALNAAALATLFARRNNVPEATRWRDTARALDPGCWMLALADTAVRKAAQRLGTAPA